MKCISAGETSGEYVNGRMTHWKNIRQELNGKGAIMDMYLLLKRLTGKRVLLTRKAVQKTGQTTSIVVE